MPSLLHYPLTLLFATVMLLCAVTMIHGLFVGLVRPSFTFWGRLLPKSRDRKDVPWNGGDLFLIFLASSIFMFMAYLVALLSGGISITPVGNASPPTVAHPVTQLIVLGRESPVVLLVAFFFVMVIAPVSEEFLYRLLLQGWLAKKEKQCKRLFFRTKQRRFLSFFVPVLLLFRWPGCLSIGLTSVYFAFLHGGSRETLDVSSLFWAMLVISVGNLLTLLFGVIYLRMVRRVSTKDLGWQPEYLWSDTITAFRFAVFVLPMVSLLAACLQNLYPNTNIDAIPIFFLSVVLGVLYYRTGRLAASVILHALLNGCSFILTLLG